MSSQLQPWDGDVRTRLAVEQLWITAGNLAEVHRVTAGVNGGVNAGVEPWADLYRLRNLIAHALPGDLSPDRLWAESDADLPRVLDAIRVSMVASHPRCNSDTGVAS